MVKATVLMTTYFFARWEFSFLLGGPAFCTCLSVLGLLMMNGMLSLLQEACLSGESDKPEGDSGST